MKGTGYRLGLIASALAFLVILACGIVLVQAQEEPKAGEMPMPAEAPKPVVGVATVTGVVSVETDDKGDITAVNVTADDGSVFKIALDEQGKKLGQEMNGKKVSVTGKIVELKAEKCEEAAEEVQPAA